ncbi:hypothetical protein M885DRAFT_478971 [Pelagophyceae sp. CCMP2097]|nr:hypothetical protein M885DRAFT_478971 [Pelagophyceae sp. CCMP2097]|mmetsp:Transcript_26447/g.91002  ORF Transcript_26447/g.91002 Transcript_26447/m.91002 type:complete len:293 (-) Transcript_26447:63-941(-)
MAPKKQKAKKEAAPAPTAARRPRRFLPHAAVAVFGLAVALLQRKSGGTQRWPIACRSPTSCGARRPAGCDRATVSDFASAAEVASLRSIAEKGMAAAGADSNFGGPTIFDINSGFVMAPGARLSNVHETRPGLFSSEDYALYKQVINRLKVLVESTFDTAKPLYFTAPTFITRLSGENSSWAPESPHDEYWQAHVDRDNTEHYEYSGLLYLSDASTDFEGGMLEFFDPHLEIEPSKGRVVLFASSEENRHKVHRVTAGKRFVLSFWFTCDKDFEFADFLDGQAHNKYGAQPA